MSFKAHPNKQVSGQMQTGILVRINNQSFSCATLRGNGMGLWTVVPPEEEEEEEAETEVAGGLAGGDWEGEVIGCGLSHITPHSVPGWPSVTTQANPIQREKNTHKIQVSQMLESYTQKMFTTCQSSFYDNAAMCSLSWILSISSRCWSVYPLVSGL